MNSPLESRPDSPDKTVARLRDLLPFIAPYKGHIAIALMFLLLAAVMTLSMPVAIRRVVDLGMVTNSSAAISQHFWLLLALGCLLAIFASLRFYMVSWIGERVVADLRSAVFSHVLKLTPSFFEQVRTGEILSRITTDTTLIQNVVGSSVSIALRSAVTLIGGLIMLAATSFKLASILLIVLPVVVVPIFLIGRRIRKLSRISQDKVADTSAVAGEILNAIEVVQAFTLEKIQRKKFHTAVDHAFQTAKKRVRTRAALTGIAMVSVITSMVAVLWVGTIDVVNGNMTGGELSQFLLYAIIVGGSTTMIGEIWGSLQQAAGATERIIELLSTEPLIKAPDKPVQLPSPTRGELRFENVLFHYPSRPENLALADFSLHIEPGESVALVGPSGAGKSTVFQLLLGFHRPQQGRILFDDCDLEHINPEELRNNIAVVPQQTMLFAASILENIRYGNPNAGDAEVIEAARKASADEFISTLPMAYDTILGERGARLSGGQQQRIAIARAILRQPSLLLLDEATSALDSESEVSVQAGLRSLAAQCTTIIIAHRLATVMEADRIVVMENGKIVATGSHQELAEKTGVYARLVELQLSGGQSKDQLSIATQR
ncbi:MAG: ABC transporter transmembrane domain-containing protein [Pseudomonadota bacterium]